MKVKEIAKDMVKNYQDWEFKISSNMNLELSKGNVTIHLMDELKQKTICLSVDGACTFLLAKEEKLLIDAFYKNDNLQKKITDRKDLVLKNAKL